LGLRSWGLEVGAWRMGNWKRTNRSTNRCLLI